MLRYENSERESGENAADRGAIPELQQRTLKRIISIFGSARSIPANPQETVLSNSPRQVTVHQTLPANVIPVKDIGPLPKGQVPIFGWGM